MQLCKARDHVPLRINNSRNRLNLDLENMSKMFHHSQKENLKVSEVAKFDKVQKI